MSFYQGRESLPRRFRLVLSSVLQTSGLPFSDILTEEEIEEAKPEKDPTLALFLGLYLILLAFFVLLNTMATLKDDRVKSVMGSLLATFSTEILNVANPTEFTASVGEDLATEEFHRDVEDFFEVAVPLAKAGAETQQ